MADKKISALTASTTPLAGTEVLPIVQGGSTVKVSVANLTAGRAVSASSLTASTDNIIIGTTAKGITTGSAIPLGLGVNGSVGAITINTTSNVGISSTDTPLKLNILSGVDTANTTTPLVLVGSDRTDFYASINSVRGAFSTVLGMSFSTTSGGAITERMLIAPAGDITASTGNLVIGTAGKGIDFSANTHAAGMTSELLNWYEEGTWTATISDGTTDATMNAGRRTGTYTRVGRQVTVHNYIATTSMTGVTGNLRIKGLPFTVGSSPTVGGSIGYCDSSMVFTLGQSMVLQTASGVDYIVIRYWNGAAGTPNMTGAQWGAVGEIGFTLTYFV
jgi:hypothetical protein